MSQTLIKRREAAMGVNAPLFYDEPLHIVRGEGVWLYDAEGRKYLDVYNNVPNVGHCHPRVVEALSEQAKTLNVHTRYLHEKVLEFSERLIALHGKGLDTAIITCSGTEANELALRMARKFTGKQGIICTNATYHGNSEAVDELATLFREGQTNTHRVKAIPFPETYRPVVDDDEDTLCDAYVRQVEIAIEEFEEEGTGFAGILICPIFANEGLPDVPRGFMKKTMELVHNHGGLFIADEVQAGFARTGTHFWGYQVSDEIPDIATMGKPMGNGHPLAGLMARRDITNHFREDVMYFNTFGGNPVQCAVGMAVLDVIEEEGLQENCRVTGDYIRDGLRKLSETHEIIGDVRGHGLFMATELVTDKETKTPASEQSRTIVNEMKNRGVLISKIGVHDNILKMRPPLPFNRDNADQLLSTLDEVLTELK